MSPDEKPRSNDGRKDGWHRDEPTEPMSSAVVTAVAETKDVSFHEMTPLYEAVDPDALNELFDPNSERDPVHVAFDYEECAIGICRNRTITVERLSTTGD